MHKFEHCTRSNISMSAVPLSAGHDQRAARRLQASFRSLLKRRAAAQASKLLVSAACRVPRSGSGGDYCFVSVARKDLCIVMAGFCQVKRNFSRFGATLICLCVRPL